MRLIAGMVLLAMIALVVSGVPAAPIPVLASGGGSSSQVGGGDFEARCAEPEVILCVSFDSDDDFDQGAGGANGARGYPFGIYPPSGTSDYSLVDRDTSVKASGTSSLRFTIPAVAGSDTSGAWITRLDPDDNAFQVGEGEEVYIQWRYRIDASILSTTYLQADGMSIADGIKIIDLSAGDLETCNPATGNDSSKCPTSCTDIETVVQNLLQRDMPQMYTACGGPVAFDGLFGNGSGSDITLQNGVGCLYPDHDSPPCVDFVPDTWMTFQLHVAVGTWDEFDSVIQLWVAQEGEASQLVIDCSPTATDKCVADEGRGEQDGWLYTDSGFEIGKLWLLPYQTNRDDECGGCTYQEEFVWYDDLIISTALIADPQ